MRKRIRREQTDAIREYLRECPLSDLAALIDDDERTVRQVLARVAVHVANPNAFSPQHDTVDLAEVIGQLCRFVKRH